MTARKSQDWRKLLEGTEVGEHVLESYVGKGKIGYVYRARHKSISTSEVAIKFTFGSLKEGWENEFRKVVLLRGIPNVVVLHQEPKACLLPHGDSAESAVYTVWQYISPGRNLFGYLDKVWACPPGFFFAVIETVLRVLHACEHKGVKRHGDLHPGNILIGEKDIADLDPDSLHPRDQIYVSDFGYGTSGGWKEPKDDYEGLEKIARLILQKIDWDNANRSDRQAIKGMTNLLGRVLDTPSTYDRVAPLEILKSVKTIKDEAASHMVAATELDAERVDDLSAERSGRGATDFQVGQFQVSEMLGENWDRWRDLFVATIPKRLRILEPDITTVLTGPRGCGKTMLFRRLSKRLMIQCGSIEEMPNADNVVGLYVNANDIVAAFESFPDEPQDSDVSRLVCCLHLYVLSEFLTVQAAVSAAEGIPTPEGLLDALHEWFGEEGVYGPLVTGESRLSRFRLTVDSTKGQFLTGHQPHDFPGFADFAHIDWFPKFLSKVARPYTAWIGRRSVLLFIDDYSLPRVSEAMQLVFNRVLFQRSSEFVSKIASEAFTTFVARDSTNKDLQEGDDYRLIDMGEETLFMDDFERETFLNEVFRRRLSLDQRIPKKGQTLAGLLGKKKLSKTEFARRLRGRSDGKVTAPTESSSGGSQRRGATKPQVLYAGHSVFSSLWSGDTRVMVQLVQDIVDEALLPGRSLLKLPVEDELQDSVFRTGGSRWLDWLTRNEPANPILKDESYIEREKKEGAGQIGFSHFVGDSYGTHLKAIAEAFKDVARFLLLGPVYRMKEGRGIRQVPRMAFRIEITDEFRLDGLALEIYKDLIRYGVFLRDARGKSVRGAWVPRLYLKRLLLPYCLLALSKRDNIPLDCNSFRRLLLCPDDFKSEWIAKYGKKIRTSGQADFFDADQDIMVVTEPAYDDLQD